MESVVKEIPDNTLAHYEKMPQVRLINLENVNCKVFGGRIDAYRAQLEKGFGGQVVCVCADYEAVQFYLFNHLVSLIKDKFTRHEVLPDWAVAVMREYKDIMAKQGVRLTSYMALITCRESRHMGSKGDDWWTKNIVVPCGQGVKDFHFHCAKGQDSMYVAKNFQTKAPDMAVGNFFKGIETMFFKGPFGGGYGAKSLSACTSS
jgi:hypothetical protein